MTDYVDIYVNGDGGEWSCWPATLYQIPTDVFDYYMLIGRLNDKEDLDALVTKLSAGEIEINKTSGCTDIWIGVGSDNWSGLPSVHFKIPSDVFGYLKDGDTEKTFGRLATEYDLERLIEVTRKEIATGVIETSEPIIRTKPTNTEVKKCGHTCTISSLKTGCCICSDIRPVVEEGTYPTYIDGHGWANSASRSAGYCPFCC